MPAIVLDDLGIRFVRLKQIDDAFLDLIHKVTIHAAVELRLVIGLAFVRAARGGDALPGVLDPDALLLKKGI